MLINEIPDDCLLAIFDYLNHIGDLINCYKVCVKWSHLIAKRTKRTKYLFDCHGYPSDAVYYQSFHSFDSTYLSKLFENLKIAVLSFVLHQKVEDANEFVRKKESLKGLIHEFCEPIEKYCDQLEMLSVIVFKSSNLRNCSSIKQLDVRNYSLEALERDAYYLPNLERLKVEIDVPDSPYDGPVLEKLKILEFYYLCYHVNNFYGFQLIDSCPNLQSAHITMNKTNWFFDEPLKHECLQDLVLQFYDTEYEYANGLWNWNNYTWNNLKRLLMKYPNLKHLALRNNHIKDEHIEQLVHILPNLILLDVSGCSEVTQRAADYVEDYCKRCKRLIKFYFNENEHEIDSDWPQLSIKPEVISRGFDFMKHCFRKDFYHLSHFLVPIDY